jgi:hypothetical protein
MVSVTLLVRESASDAGKEHIAHSSSGAIMIGADPRSDVRLSGEGVQPFHAKLDCDMGQVWLHGLSGSTDLLLTRPVIQIITLSRSSIL